MFENLTDRLGNVFNKLTKRGILKEADINAALSEVRIALLEADVALPVVKTFISAVREKALGGKVIQSVTPGQMVVKIVHDQLVIMLGSENTSLNLAGTPPSAILMVGLQGSGKTTTSAKLGLRLTKREKKHVLLASLDVYRPAAQQQLATLGEQANLSVLSSIFGEQPIAIAKRAMETGRREGIDIVILDSAGRLHVDSELMTEIAEIQKATNPIETLILSHGNVLRG